MSAIDKISSGMGAGMARPTSPQETGAQQTATKAAGFAEKAAKASKVKSVKVKVAIKKK